MDILNRFKMRLYPFLRIDRICHAVFKLRFFYFVQIKRSIRNYGDTTGVISHPYSLNMVLKGRANTRPLRLIRPLSVVDQVKKDGDVLSVGCRFEKELLYLAAYGFQPEKIRGLDMVSYSPWVDVGNMHSMPYPDNRWDVVVLGWVISYSSQPDVAAREVVRIARNGAAIAIGVSYYPIPMLVEMQENGTSEGSCVGDPASRKQTVAALLDLFKGHVDEIYFAQEAPDKTRPGMCTVIFSIKK